MPGFVIGDSPGVASTLPSGRRDWLRTHRYRLLQLLSVKDIALGKNSELLALRDVQLPTKSISEISVITPATTYKFAKNVKYGDFKMTFYGSRRALELIVALQDTVHNVITGVGDFNEYKDIVKFMMYDEYDTDGNVIDDQDSAVVYTLHNAWISDVEHGSLTYTSSDIHSISCTVKCDFFHINLGKEDAVLGLLRQNGSLSSTVSPSLFNS